MVASGPRERGPRSGMRERSVNRAASAEEDGGDDEAVLVAACSGSAEARAAFVDRFAPLVYAVLSRSRRSSNARELEDLFAMVFVALFDRDARRLRLWNRRCSAASWVRIAVTSVAVDRARRERGERRMEPASDWLEELASEDGAAIEALARAEDLARIDKALASLSVRDRELVRWLCIEERAPAEVAAELGVALGALYTRKNRALERLRRAYDALLGDGL